MMFLAADAAGQTTSWAALTQPIILIGLMFAAMYFFILRPQKKREKEVAKMRRGLEIGDEITTIGGINGRIVSVKDDDLLVIETGPDKTKIRIKRWAIQTRDTISE